MAKYNGDYNLIKNVLLKTKQNFKGQTKWKNDNTLVFTKNKEEVGTIKMDNLSVSVSGTSLNKEWAKNTKLYEEKIKAVVTESQTHNTPLTQVLVNKAVFNNLYEKPEIFKKLLARLKKIGISNVEIGTDVNRTHSIKEDLNLHFDTSASSDRIPHEAGYSGRLRTFLFSEFQTKYDNKSGIPLRDIYKHNLFDSEKTKDIMYNGMLIGTYYPERNLICINFNPFKLQDFTIFDDSVPDSINTILTAIENLKPKKKDISKIQEKIFVSEFMKSSNQRLENIKADMRNEENNIAQSEASLRAAIERHTAHSEEFEFISQLVQTKGNGIYDEIKKTEKLSFIEKLTIEGATIDMKFKPSFLPLPNFQRNEGGKKYGKRYVWIGSIGFRISPGNFRVYGDVKIDPSHCHTHGSGFPEGSPCFGEGAGRNKIYILLASNKFVDLAKMLWFWTKTHVNSGAYVKCWTAYDNTLMNGYPLFDEKGNRVEINDKERIKTGEQVKLNKNSCYAKNKKKFEKIKLEV